MLQSRHPNPPTGSHHAVPPELLPELAALPTRHLWQHFTTISSIPRPSGHEEQIRNHLRGLAAERGWEDVCDTAGNCVIRIPGRGRLADAPYLVLQGHMDMVCEKNGDVRHDFLRDPIRLHLEGPWLRAAGTTLGADNGIALALGLALGDADLRDRVPLELLFTVDEETGLTGATNLDPAIVRGRRIINLDSEDEGVLIIGCAGGRNVTVRFPRSKAGSPPHSQSVTCTVHGLRGGHSGINIHEDRANAIVALAPLIAELTRFPDARLIGLTGGCKRNAIPREASVTLTGVPLQAAEKAAGALQHALLAAEPEARVTARRGPAADRAPLPRAVARFLEALPNGVVAMDPHFSGLVRTSSSLGVAADHPDRLELMICTRSSDLRDRDSHCQRLAALAREHGAEVELDGAYPGWAPNPNSRLLAALTTAYRDHTGQSPEVTAVHAGLEAGIISSLLDTEELVALGPTIETPHSPDERMLVQSADRVYRFLEQFISTAAYHPTP